MIRIWRHRLNSRIDNSPLVLFRICFGALMFFEGTGAIATGWARETFIEPPATFPFIGFEFLQVLNGPPVYVMYVVIALLGLAIALGWHFRFSMIAFTLLWPAVYLAQKTHYNNHHYLVWLVAGFLAVSPAHTWRSLDVSQGRVAPEPDCPAWNIRLFQVQIALVYFFAAVAKLYPDWLAARPVSLWFGYKEFTSPFWGAETAAWLQAFFKHDAVHYFFSWGGIAFDFLVVPAFIWKPTRTLALVASLAFHGLNSLLFQIGVFPYFALSFIVFFYDRDRVRRRFFPRKPAIAEGPSGAPLPALKTVVLAAFVLWQAFLPLRHWRIPGDVLWTEEGHRLSWRMMLRSKHAVAEFRAVHPESGLDERIALRDHLSRDQARLIGWKPDMAWQFAQRLDAYYLEKHGIDVAIYASSRVSVNGRPHAPFLDGKTDLSAVRWKRFGHQEWLLPAPF